MIAFACLAALACTTTRPPTELLRAAELAIEQAGERESGTYAPLELRLAREKLDDARSAMAEERYDRSARLAEQALVNAELAEVKARTAQTQRSVTELREAVEVLRVEIERASSRSR